MHQSIAGVLLETSASSLWKELVAVCDDQRASAIFSQCCTAEVGYLWHCISGVVHKTSSISIPEWSSAASTKWWALSPSMVQVLALGLGVPGCILVMQCFCKCKYPKKYRHPRHECS